MLFKYKHKPHCAKQKNNVTELANHHPKENDLLGALSPEVQGRLFPYLELVKLPMGGVMYECDRPMRHVYFPVDAIISLQYILLNGESTSILVVGKEGLLGIKLCLGVSETAPSRSLVQYAGYAFRLPKKLLKEELSRNGQFQKLMLRYTESMISHISQTAICNRHHTIDQQLCRWLLLTLDRMSEVKQLTMTQEFISNMLGVRRESITQAARKLQKEGVIDYIRGQIKVLDRTKLEAQCCECYEAVKKETAKILDYLPQRQIVKNFGDIPTLTVPTSA